MTYELVKVWADKWRKYMEFFFATREEISARNSGLLAQVEGNIARLSTKLVNVQHENQLLRERIQVEKSTKAKLQNKIEVNSLEIGAETDLELKLQQKTVELQLQLGERKRRLDRQLQKKATLKKAYIRVIEKYREMKSEHEQKENRRKAMQKKSLLEKRKRELEEAEQRAKAAESDPITKYRALLAAAGHGTFSERSRNIVGSGPTSFYQGPLVLGTEGPSPEQILVDNPQFDEGIWLENNIRTLLSTGNYTDDDPVIRSLRNQLRQLRC
jgi:hypothetical protein